MQWSDYLKTHSFFDELQLPAGDSFWLFDPMGISDMSLFRNDVQTKTKNHDNALEHIKANKIDVLHGIGLFGRTPPEYSYPDRNEIAKAFDYLAKHGCKIRVYVSHGNVKHVHNIPKASPERRYQCGDLPFSNHYILDIVQDYGIEYFWNSALRQDLSAPYRMSYPVLTPSGSRINTFVRFGQWGCGAHTFPQILNEELLNQAIRYQQNLVIFSHWGMPGLNSTTPDDPLLNDAVVESFHLLQRMHQQKLVEVVRLGELLDFDKKYSLSHEADRILDFQPETKGEPATHASSLYAELCNQMGLRGHQVLDATTEQGKFGVHLTESFNEVICLEKNQSDLDAGRYLADCLGVQGISFGMKPLDTLSLGPNCLDAAFCRASLLIESPNTIDELYHSLRAGKPLGIFVDDNSSESQLRSMCETAKFRTFEWQDKRVSNGQETDFLGNSPRFFAAK